MVENSIKTNDKRSVSFIFKLQLLKQKLQSLEENQEKSRNIISLKTRINDFVFASSYQIAEVDPIKNIQDSVTVCGENYLDIHPQEPWPQPIYLFQPYEVEQILLPDNANCLAVQAYLKMCNLEFHVESRWNAEYMSPSAKIPFIKCGASVVSDFDNIVTFISNKGSSLSENLSAHDKANLRAFMSLVNSVLYYAELYICWYNDDIYKNITQKRHGCAYPWPLNHYLNWQKRNQIIKRLSIFPWARKSIDQVFEEVKKCCESLSERLSDKMYFFGDTPNELDALVFGHLFSILTTPLNNENTMAKLVENHPRLISYCRRIEDRYFQHDEE